MILGIGSDLVDVRRIERVIARHGERFLARIYTDIERAKADRRANRFETYAKRFAAKEACAKALGTGLRAGVFWRDMGVVNLASGQPTMRPPFIRREAVRSTADEQVAHVAVLRASERLAMSFSAGRDVIAMTRTPARSIPG